MIDRPRARWLTAGAMILVATIACARRAAASGSQILRELACTSCHLDARPARYLYPSFDAFAKAPPPAPTGCAQCHVSNRVATAPARPAGWLPLTGGMVERIRQFHAYVDAPPLVTRVELADRSGKRQTVARFTACGLARFLSAPVARRGAARQSMFPVEPSRLRQLITALGTELEPCGDPAAPAQVERGRSLFAQQSCITCHAGDGAGPRLRLGFPLLARTYFRARVQRGTVDRPAAFWQRRWSAVNGQLVATGAGTVTMPAHPDLSPADLDALYAYVSSDRSDVAPPAEPTAPIPRVDVPDAIRLSLYREVQRRVFDTSCRHCHSPDVQAQRLIASVFGPVASAAPVELPMTRLAVSPSPTLRRLLSPGPNCTESPLLVRLDARRAEWTGHGVAGAPRGMPMTLPPLDRDAIRLVAAWSAAGCPSDRGDLCDACPAANIATARR